MLLASYASPTRIWKRIIRLELESRRGHKSKLIDSANQTKGRLLYMTAFQWIGHLLQLSQNPRRKSSYQYTARIPDK
jgi:hypothetical protein